MTKTTCIEIPISYCPLCKHKLDAATDVEDDCRSPKPGDLSVCVSCGNVLKFREDLSVQVAFKEDLAKLDATTLRKLMILRRAIEIMQKEEGK